MDDLLTLADRLNRAIDQLENSDDTPVAASSNKADIASLLKERHNDLETLNSLRQEVRNLIEEIKND